MYSHTLACTSWAVRKSGSRIIVKVSPTVPLKASAQRGLVKRWCGLWLT